MAETEVSRNGGARRKPDGVYLEARNGEDLEGLEIVIGGREGFNKSINGDYKLLPPSAGPLSGAGEAKNDPAAARVRPSFVRQYSLALMKSVGLESAVVPLYLYYDDRSQHWLISAELHSEVGMAKCSGPSPGNAVTSEIIGEEKTG